MPAKKTYRKRRANRRRGRRRALGPSRVVSGTSPFPDKYLTKIRYSTLDALSFIASGNPVYRQYRLNSPYDPYFSVGGGQPYGYDQLEALYNRYRVFGCKYHIEFATRNGSYHAEVAVGLRPNSTVHTSMNTILESPYNQHRTMGVLGSNKAVQTISGYASIAKVFGQSKKQVASDLDFSAQVTANPLHQPILTVYLYNMTTNQNLDCAYRITLEYFTCFYDRKALPGSS